MAVGSRKLAVFEGAALGHIGRLAEVGLHVPPEATAGCLCTWVRTINARITTVKAMTSVRSLKTLGTKKILKCFMYFFNIAVEKTQEVTRKVKSLPDRTAPFSTRPKKPGF
jgi:hypothetical protein